MLIGYVGRENRKNKIDQNIIHIMESFRRIAISAVRIAISYRVQYMTTKDLKTIALNAKLLKKRKHRLHYNFVR